MCLVLQQCQSAIKVSSYLLWFCVCVYLDMDLHGGLQLHTLNTIALGDS